jgi:hypothetical protein
VCAFFFKLSFVPACGIIILENVGINSEALTKNDGKVLYFDANRRTLVTSVVS